MKNLLALDTSTDVGSVAILQDGIVVAETLLRAPMDLLSWLSPTIRQILDKTHLTMQDLNTIAVGTGPGSFTGVRLELATARTLAQVLGIPLFGISSLEALAFQCLPFCGKILSCIDARRGELFTGIFKAEGRVLTRHEDFFAMSPESLIEKIALDEGPWLLVGELNPYKALLLERLKRMADSGPRAGVIRASSIGFLAYEKRFEKPKSTVDVEPIYIRSSQAEIDRIKSARS